MFTGEIVNVAVSGVPTTTLGLVNVGEPIEKSGEGTTCTLTDCVWVTLCDEFNVEIPRMETLYVPVGVEDAAVIDTPIAVAPPLCSVVDDELHDIPGGNVSGSQSIVTVWSNDPNELTVVCTEVVRPVSTLVEAGDGADNAKSITRSVAAAWWVSVPSDPCMLKAKSFTFGSLTVSEKFPEFTGLEGQLEGAEVEDAAQLTVTVLL